MNIEDDIIKRCSRRLRDMLAVVSTGTLVFVVIPNDFLSWPSKAAQQAFSWLVPGLSIYPAERKPLHLLEVSEGIATHWNHHLIDKMRLLHKAVSETCPLEIAHQVDTLPGDRGETEVFYGEGTWHSLLWGVAPDLVEALLDPLSKQRWETEENESFWLTESIEMVATHRDLPSVNGNVKAMAVTCGNGGVGVIPEPLSVTALVEWLSPAIGMTPNKADPREALRAELESLAGDALHDLNLSNNCLVSLGDLINAVVEAPTRAEFFARFGGASRDAVRREIRDRLPEKRNELSKFSDRILACVDNKPTK